MILSLSKTNLPKLGDILFTSKNIHHKVVSINPMLISSSALYTEGVDYLHLSNLEPQTPYYTKRHMSKEQKDKYKNVEYAGTYYMDKLDVIYSISLGYDLLIDVSVIDSDTFDLYVHYADLREDESKMLEYLFSSIDMYKIYTHDEYHSILSMVFQEGIQYTLDNAKTELGISNAEKICDDIRGHFGSIKIENNETNLDT